MDVIKTNISVFPENAVIVIVDNLCHTVKINKIPDFSIHKIEILYWNF